MSANKVLQNSLQTLMLEDGAHNEQANFNKGYYKSEYTIHELATLTADDLQNISESSSNDILSKMDAFHFCRVCNRQGGCQPDAPECRTQQRKGRGRELPRPFYLRRGAGCAFPQIGRYPNCLPPPLPPPMELPLP
ncbi:MAG: hypothetical protein PHS97_04705 [Oscillospiraceae bacterium]|nr:hypothetical protein [Oscillospiraceae bacterium]